MTGTITYRKTQRGEWVACGSPAAMRAGCQVAVTRKDGSTETRLVKSTGKAFGTPEGPRCYGYLAPRAGQAPRSPGTAGECQVCGGRPHKCDECGERWPVTAARDLSGLAGCACATCARSGALSFA